MKSLYVLVFLVCTITGYSQTTLTLHFESNKHELTSAAKARLDSFFLAEKQDISALTIDIDGHCDITGTEGYNNTLSEKRALTVKEYLLKKGVILTAIANTRSHGKSAPLNENKTAAERQLNRRVDVRITKAVQASLSPENEKLSLSEKIADTATKAGATIALKNINFYGSSPLPLPESFVPMDELLEIMRVHHTLVIEIRGHICCVPYSGDNEYTNTGNGLSEERARTVYAHLVGNGIEASRVSYKGFGHSQPIFDYPEKTEEERIANRRVEIKIISK
ncbi:MAG: OmpA family protein [Bacteroidota bacterium]